MLTQTARVILQFAWQTSYTHPCLCLSSRPGGRFLFLSNRFHGKDLPLVDSHLIYLGLQYIEEFCGMGTVHLSVVELER